MTSIDEHYAEKEAAAQIERSQLESTQHESWVKILVHQLHLRWQRYSQTPPDHFHWVKAGGEIAAAWPVGADSQGENWLYLFQDGKIGWAKWGSYGPSHENPAILTSYVSISDLDPYQLGSLFDSVTSDPDSADYACYRSVHWHQPWAVAERHRIMLP